MMLMLDNLLGVVEFASQQILQQNTTNIEISFNVGEGMSDRWLVVNMFLEVDHFKQLVY